MVRLVPMIPIAAAVYSLSLCQAAAETERQLGAHEHGHGTLSLAIEGKTINMELRVPGADIVGFEHKAEAAEDKTKIGKAEKTLAEPLTLFGLPDAARCKIESAKVSLASEDEPDNDHEQDAHDGHAKKEKHEEEDEATHSEFHAQYSLVCANVQAVATISFPYFDVFPNSEELTVTIITEKGQKAFEVSREHALIDLRGMI
jgi:uncharacterized protein YsxB (DUF464 family)